MRLSSVRSLIKRSLSTEESTLGKAMLRSVKANDASITNKISQPTQKPPNLEKTQFNDVKPIPLPHVPVQSNAWPTQPPLNSNIQQFLPKICVIGIGGRYLLMLLTNNLQLSLYAGAGCNAGTLFLINHEVY